jgi:hypothetical protein
MMRNKTEYLRDLHAVFGVILWDIIFHPFLGVLQSMNTGTSDVVAALVNVEKVKNVVYISALVTMIGPKVNGQKAEILHKKRANHGRYR